MSPPCDIIFKLFYCPFIPDQMHFRLLFGVAFCRSAARRNNGPVTNCPGSTQLYNSIKNSHELLQFPSGCDCGGPKICMCACPSSQRGGGSRLRSVNICSEKDTFKLLLIMSKSHRFAAAAKARKTCHISTNTGMQSRICRLSFSALSSRGK